MASYHHQTYTVDPNSKLAKIRAAMAAGDWDTAIKLAARFDSLGAHGTAITRGKEAMSNPEFYRQLGHDLLKIRQEAIEALKAKYSLSWAEAQKSHKR
jgi:hypothetical protein